MKLVNCKRLKSAFCLTAAVLVLCCNLFSVPALPVQAAGDDTVIIPDYPTEDYYTLSYAVMCGPDCGPSYYHHYNIGVTCNAQLFLFLIGDPDDAVSTQYSVNVGIYDAENQKVYDLLESGAKNFTFSCYSYTDISYKSATGELYRTTTITDGSAAVGLYKSKAVHKTSMCYYTCGDYVFKSKDAALAYFSVGDISGLINEPAPQPDPDDPTLDPDYDPDSFYGKVLEMLRNVIFGDWKFEKFLNLFSSNIFKDWSFTKFLQLFQQSIFGNWNFESFKKIFSGEIFADWKFSDFLDMIYTAMFGSSSEQPTNIWEFLRGCLFGSVQKYTDFWGFLEDAFKQVKEFDYAGFWDSIKEQLSDLSFEKIRDIINTGFFGPQSRYENIWDYFDEKFGLSDVKGVYDFLVELVNRAAFGDGKHNLFGILFVPDEEAMQEMWADIKVRFSGIFGLMDSGNRIVNFLKTCSGQQAPSFTVNLGSSASYYLGNETITIDFSWYTPYKPTVDLLFAGIIWAGFIWRMYSRIPEIIGGVGMAVSMPYRLEHFEMQNERMKETRYRSDFRWTNYLESLSRRRHRR